MLKNPVPQPPLPGEQYNARREAESSKAMTETADTLFALIHVLEKYVPTDMVNPKDGQLYEVLSMPKGAGLLEDGITSSYPWKTTVISVNPFKVSVRWGMVNGNLATANGEPLGPAVGTVTLDNSGSPSAKWVLALKLTLSSTYSDANGQVVTANEMEIVTGTTDDIKEYTVPAGDDLFNWDNFNYYIYLARENYNGETKEFYVYNQRAQHLSLSACGKIISITNAGNTP
ncbi:MAG: hypothetical protein LBK60_06295 [Verrucomicrobiales bacterium]|nr:hypothetical protein [Verrucomicrobiales bacterium]